MDSPVFDDKGKYVLGYWDIRGLAAPIRMSLTHSNMAYRDELYSLVQVEGRWRSSWPTKAKEMLASRTSSFPNLPYLLIPAGDGHRCLVQSNAILRHIARIGHLYGNDEIAMSEVDELLEQTMDLRNEMTRLNYGQDFIAKREGFCRDSIPYYFTAFEKWLSTRVTTTDEAFFFVGGQATVADFAIFDALDVAKALAAPYFDTWEQYPLLAKHSAHIRRLPSLTSYFSSSVSTLPMNNKVASWGGSNL